MKKPIIILCLFLLHFFSLTADENFFINGKLNAGDYVITNSPAVVNEVGGEPVKNLVLEEDGALYLTRDDFNNGMIIRFSLVSNLPTEDEYKWNVSIKNNLNGLKLLTPKTGILLFRKDSKFFFKVDLTKKIEGKIILQVSKQNIQYNEEISIPISIKNSSTVSLTSQDDIISKIGKLIKTLLIEMEAKMKSGEDKIANLNQPINKLQGKKNFIDRIENNIGVILALGFAFFCLWGFRKKSKELKGTKQELIRLKLIGDGKQPPKPYQPQEKTPPIRPEEPEYTFRPIPKKRLPLSTDKQFKIEKYENEYYRINLENVWKDTLVSIIYFKIDCVIEMNKSVLDSHRDKNETPETAGFLLGNYWADTDEKGNQFFNVVCDVFVPAKHHRGTQVEVEFTSETFEYLSDQMNKYPDLRLVGWFHTHPGLTVFLSNSDKNIHFSHFKEKWQIAMVVDSKKDSLGIFTWRKQNEINDRTSGLIKQNFPNWKTLYDWLVK